MPAARPKTSTSHARAPVDAGRAPITASPRGAAEGVRPARRHAAGPAVGQLAHPQDVRAPARRRRAGRRGRRRLRSRAAAAGAVAAPARASQGPADEDARRRREPASGRQPDQPVDAAQRRLRGARTRRRSARSTRGPARGRSPPPAARAPGPSCSGPWSTGESATERPWQTGQRSSAATSSVALRQRVARAGPAPAARPRPGGDPRSGPPAASGHEPGVPMASQRPRPPHRRQPGQPQVRAMSVSASSGPTCLADDLALASMKNVSGHAEDAVRDRGLAVGVEQGRIGRRRCRRRKSRMRSLFVLVDDAQELHVGAQVARAARTSTGCSWKQGTHQVAQKLRTTGRPAAQAQVGAPPPTGDQREGRGAGRPTSGEATACGIAPQVRDQHAQQRRRPPPATARGQDLAGSTLRRPPVSPGASGRARGERGRPRPRRPAAPARPARPAPSRPWRPRSSPPSG